MNSCEKNNAIFPWQEKAWQQVLWAKQEKRLPHAILLLGISGLGKLEFANRILRLLFCQQGAENGDCHACRLLIGRTHPNVKWVEPEKSGAAIKVDQIREANDFIAQSAFQGEYKVVIIYPADEMNLAAANALLKTLEEPTDHTILLLLAEQAKRLPATVISRCQHIHFTPPSIQEGLQWLMQQPSHHTDWQLGLKLTQGAPLAALALFEGDFFAERKVLFTNLCDVVNQKTDGINAATKIQAMDLLLFLNLMLSWMSDLLKLQLTADTTLIMNQDYESILAGLAQKTILEKNMRLLDQLQQLRIQMSMGINLNKLLTIENILLRWMNAYVPS